MSGGADGATDPARAALDHADHPFCGCVDGDRCPLPRAETTLGPSIEAGERLSEAGA